MGLREIVSWYQKKIGTYDKQLWEKTVEQRILHGLKHVPMKTAKLRTDFIDVDLVKGSSFPKAKPKHGLMTVARLGIFRLLFLPIYGRWWIKQTSFRIFSLILVMYILEFINLVLYVNRPLVKNDQKERVPSSEVIIPLVMMTLLSIIHSQIVSTTPESGKRNNEVKSHKTKRRRKLRQRKLFSDQKPSKHTKHEPDNLKKKVEHNRHVLWDINDRSTTPVENIEENIENGEEVLKKQPLDDDGFESLTNSVPSENEDQLNKSSEKNTKNRDCSSDDLPNKSSFSSDKNGSEDSTQNTNETEIYKNDKFTSEKHESETDSDQNLLKIRSSKRTKMTIRQGILHTRTVESSDCDTEDECETVSSPETVDTTVNPTDWMGVTTNSDDCSYSSEYDDTDDQSEPNLNDQFWDMDLLPTAILSPSCTSRDRVSCTIWEHNDIKKADLSVLDISSTIIERVEAMPETMDYFYGGVLLSVLLSLVPTIILFCGIMVEPTVIAEAHLTIVEISGLMLEQLLELVYQIMDMILGFKVWERFIIITSIFLRCILGSLFFFLMALAERTFKQRFLYAKLFSHLTSSRRARKSNLPHFRLNKVRNIKTWLSVRSYLKKRGPQRSVDLIVSAAFIITLILLSFISIELLRDSIFLHSQYNLEAVLWCLAIGIYLLRFMTLGTTINSKYRNLSVLITEQINLYLQIEQKPHKKDELMVANSVLKLAADLLKELESPFKISGLSANPYLYTVTKVVILSALSGVLSEMLGFKLKLYKIKIV